MSVLEPHREFGVIEWGEKCHFCGYPSSLMREILVIDDNLEGGYVPTCRQCYDSETMQPEHRSAGELRATVARESTRRNYDAWAERRYRIP